MNHIQRDDPNYITPSYYYNSKYSLIEVMKDQLSPVGFSGALKGLIIKYVLGAENNPGALRRLTKAKYYLDELTMFREEQTKDKVSEDVLHPKYYAKSSIEPIEVIDDELSDEESFGFYIFMIMRYVSREAKKEGLADLKKAQYYLNRLIKRLEEKGQSVEKSKH